ncbi:beta-ketoacyl-ACP synthase III [Rhodococcus sp. G-MC3]|uniref:beta-ketoacyl-ACP synthase III n=1 Tax=Rhodococcus sp. G-MC3 TaxID=3046209 RepID=UPI0024B93774|nr:beta-ketoacyl-ACP synthase III [Rhodococcus sp. G-MC3]MDJ0396732.1 beta-ketoacyl-ACP synthase III [Rhodococcus sp. G-MC3]
MPNASIITGLGATVPDTVITNDMLAERIDTSDEWIRSRTGIEQRRHVDVGTSTGDLAAIAGRRALRSADRASVGAVVLATTTPDYPCPATAPWVASELGLDGAIAFDIGAVCSGFVYATAVASGLLASNLTDSVLVIGAEAFTTIINPDDRNTAPIFGDGAGAIVLERGSRESPGALLEFDLGSDGNLHDLIIVREGGSEHRTSGADLTATGSFMTMQGKTVFANAVKHMTQSSQRVLSRTLWTAAEIDWLVAHQANTRILDAVSDQLGIDSSKALVSLNKYGNTAGASIPLALADAATQGHLSMGDRVLLTAFGGGATWGSLTLRWPEVEAVTNDLQHRKGSTMSKALSPLEIIALRAEVSTPGSTRRLGRAWPGRKTRSATSIGLSALSSPTVSTLWGRREPHGRTVPV